MCKVMEKPFPVVFNVSQVMTINEHDIEVFLNYYSDWKKDKKCFSFFGIADYPLLGVTKPITSTGCIAMTLTQKDRAKEECLRRIKETKQEFHLPEDKQKALDEIYRQAEVNLLK